jgi:alkanesulfonate monooxygenase SsuD/methylene tetrahydromethanopterin reductase-like flavin-dependent oxidoreductase (luciferase family)
VKIGVLLPSFRHDAADAFRAAQLAEQCGLDGVFAYDHLWPMGAPERPSLAPFPLLAALGARSKALVLAPLVARVGLLSSSALVEQFRTLALIAPQRVIVALGTGDKLSEAENAAYGLAVRGANERRELLSEVARELSDLEIWVGAGSRATNVLARELNAVLNLWNVEPARVREMRDDGPVCWAGNAREDLEKQLDELANAGATWAVFSPTVNVPRLGAWSKSQPETK